MRSKRRRRLNHPNIVTAYDAEQAGDEHFLVMEFVDGVDLSKAVKEEGALSPAQACEYVQQAALGLQHAFEQGMVHRDIKPHNLMVTRDGRVRILDFGLASLTHMVCEPEHENQHDGELTMAGSVIGTPDYISPEQAIDARSADIRSDIYSLGATLFFLLTGQAPLEDGDVRQKLKHLAEGRVRSLQQLRSDLPSELVQIVERMMCMSPSQRFQTPDEVADVLLPLSKRAQPEQQSTDPSRSRTAGARTWLAGACAVLVLIAAFVFARPLGQALTVREHNAPQGQVLNTNQSRVGNTARAENSSNPENLSATGKSGAKDTKQALSSPSATEGATAGAVAAVPAEVAPISYVYFSAEIVGHPFFGQPYKGTHRRTEERLRATWQSSQVDLDSCDA